MEIIATNYFIKSAKPLAKKYRSFNSDYQHFLLQISQNPHLGIDLGEGFRKVRMAISSKGKGKSGGARVITLDMIKKNESIYLLYVYDKSEHDTIALGIIKEIVKEMNL